MLARRLTHARLTAPSNEVEILAPLEKMAGKVSRELDDYLSGYTKQRLKPLADLKVLRAAFRCKTPIPGEPLNWHLPSSRYDTCLFCGRPTIKMDGRRHRFCTECGGDWQLSGGVGWWCQQKIRACRPRRLRGCVPGICAFPGCEWDQYRGDWCDFHGLQFKNGRELTPHPRPRQECRRHYCSRAVVPQSDWCSIHPPKKRKKT